MSELGFFHLQAIQDQCRCFGGSGDRPEAKNVVLTITDGYDKYQSSIDEAETLRIESSKKIINIIVSP